MVFVLANRLLAVAGNQHRVSGVFQHVHCQIPHNIVILGHQDDLRPALRNGLFNTRRRLRGRRTHGQVDLERRAPADITGNTDHPIVLTHDSVHRGEPQPCAPALAFSREERLEDPSLRLFIHPTARVADAQKGVPLSLSS